MSYLPVCRWTNDDDKRPTRCLHYLFSRIYCIRIYIMMYFAVSTEKSTLLYFMRMAMPLTKPSFKSIIRSKMTTWKMYLVCMEDQSGKIRRTATTVTAVRRWAAESERTRKRDLNLLLFPPFFFSSSLYSLKLTRHRIATTMSLIQ